jgi:antitoxin ParD1/3/4
MTIHLSSDRARYVRSLIDGGRFPSEDAVIEEALRLLQEREDELNLESLRRDVATGMEQADRGELGRFNPDASMARIRSRRITAAGPR